MLFICLDIHINSIDLQLCQPPAQRRPQNLTNVSFRVSEEILTTTQTVLRFAKFLGFTYLHSFYTSTLSMYLNNCLLCIHFFLNSFRDKTQLRTPFNLVSYMKGYPPSNNTFLWMAGAYTIKKHLFFVKPTVRVSASNHLHVFLCITLGLYVSVSV